MRKNCLSSTAYWQLCYLCWHCECLRYFAKWLRMKFIPEVAFPQFQTLSESRSNCLNILFSVAWLSTCNNIGYELAMPYLQFFLFSQFFFLSTHKSHYDVLLPRLLTVPTSLQTDTNNLNTNYLQNYLLNVVNNCYYFSPSL